MPGIPKKAPKPLQQFVADGNVWVLGGEELQSQHDQTTFGDANLAVFFVAPGAA